MKTLFLAWQDPTTRAWLPVGRLTFDGKMYTFAYTQGAKEAQDIFWYTKYRYFGLYPQRNSRGFGSLS